MATIPSSPEWSLVPSSSYSTSCFAKPNKFPASFTPLPSYRSNFNHHIKTSSFPSAALLEEDNKKEETPQKFRFRFQRDNSQPYPASDAENLNAFLSGLLQDPMTEPLAYEHYQEAKERKPGFKPEKSVVKLLLRYLARSKNWDGLILLLSDDLRRYGNGSLPDAYTCSKLVESCVQARKFKAAERLLGIFVQSDDTKISVLSFNAAMKGYNKLHMYSSTIRMYNKMNSLGTRLNSGCYYQSMKAYQKLGKVDKVMALFHECVDQKSLDTKEEVLSKMYRVLCESLAKSGRASDAIGYLRDMMLSGNKKGGSGSGSGRNHSVVYSSLICSLANSGQVGEAEMLFEEAIQKNVLRDPEVFSKLVSMYIAKGQVEKTLDVVKVMSCDAKLKVSDCILCTVVSGFAKRKGFSAAVKVYEELISKGYEPGQVTYASAVNAYYRIEQYPKAEMVFLEMQEKGFDKCVVAYSTMITMYGKLGRVRDAMRLLGEMKQRKCEPNIWVYNALLDMHGKAMNLRQVEKLWKEVERRRLAPDKVSYTSVISAYSKAQRFDECVKYFEEYRMRADNGGSVDMKMAGIMVGVFSNMSLIDELVKLLRDMKSVGTVLDGRLYRTALNALRDAGMESQSRWLMDSFQGN
ncbi:Pentatricopeptide repeat-containing protein At5g13770, chloroplastic [Linum grandiflorum]